VVRLLVETGKAEVDTKDSRRGQTPLSWAAENGHLEVVRLLVATGKSEVDSKDNSGWTPLSWAAENGHLEVVRLLVETGKVEVDSKDNSGHTPLTWAAKNGYLEVVKFLVQEAQPKADIRSKDNDDKTALDLATAVAEKKEEEGKPLWNSEQQWEWEMEQRRAVVALLRDLKEKQERDYDTGGDDQRGSESAKAKEKK